MKQTTAPSLDILARTLCLSSVVREHARVADIATTEQWTYEQYLYRVLEIETAERQQRRIERLLKASHLPEGKSLATLEKELLTPLVRTQLARMLEGDFIHNAVNVLVFGLPGRGKTHLVAAVGRDLLMRLGVPILFISTFGLVQQLLRAKSELRLEQYLAKLDRFDAIIIDDIGYVQQSREEMEVLFTFLADRYERKSLMITSNLVFSQWDRIFKDPMTTAAAIDRLVHHSIIVELTGESYRMEKAGVEAEKENYRHKNRTNTRT
jgi:DNA replication protein DnaC